MPEDESLPEVLREIDAPDGTKYTVYSDGTWVCETWDGQFVKDSVLGSTTPEEVLARFGAPIGV